MYDTKDFTLTFADVAPPPELHEQIMEKIRTYQRWQYIRIITPFAIGTVLGTALLSSRLIASLPTQLASIDLFWIAGTIFFLSSTLSALRYKRYRS